MPLYHQLASDLRDRILARDWEPGERISSEGELARLYETSRVTVRQALRILVDEGLISREPGRGSFVRDGSITANTRRLTSFTAEMHVRNIRPSARVLGQQMVPAQETVADALALPPGSPVLELIRLRRGDDAPIGLQTNYLDYRRFGDLVSVDFTTASLYAELHHRYGILVDEAEETYSATAVDESGAVLLGLAPGNPVLTVTRRGFQGETPVEYTTSLMRADRYQIEMRLSHAQHIDKS